MEKISINNTTALEIKSYCNIITKLGNYIIILTVLIPRSSP